VTVKNVSNLSASVQARLQNHARASKRPFQELLQYYAMERFLYRLSTTPHRARFVLKGALMLYVWEAPLARATKDLDFLGRLDNPLENLERVVHEVCTADVEPDGIVGYPRETVVAEKFQAMVYLRTLNSRMKDFYDVWLPARQFAFDGDVLAKAIAATFANRETAIDVAPIAFTPEFTEQTSTLAQWTAFRKKLPNIECPETLADVVPFFADFLLPIARACAAGESFEQRWPPGGPWSGGR